MGTSTDAAVLVIEDEVDFLTTVVEYLSAVGHQVDCASHGRDGLNLAASNQYDVIVLDIGLPGLDGLAICRQLRASARSAVGIIMLTARDTLDDKLSGLELGADDYLIKPTALAELDQRIRALRRRLSLNRGEVLRFGPLSYNVASGEVRRDGVVLSLTPACEKLLHCLLQQAPYVVSRDQLSRCLWGDDPPDSDALKVYIHMLREVLDRPFDKAMVKTVRGKGYQLAA